MDNQKQIIIALMVIIVIAIGAIFIWRYKGKPKKSSGPSEIAEQTEQKKEKEFCSLASNRGSSHTVEEDIVFCDSKGRMWTETATSGMAWKGAVDYCQKLNYAGFQDWQLPSCESDENCVLYQFGKEACGWKKDEEKECAPSWDKNANESTSKYPYGYWSSTEMKNTEQAGRVDFYNGNLLSATKDHIFSVRCVRK